MNLDLQETFSTATFVLAAFFVCAFGSIEIFVRGGRLRVIKLMSLIIAFILAIFGTWLSGSISEKRSNIESSQKLKEAREQIYRDSLTLATHLVVESNCVVTQRIENAAVILDSSVINLTNAIERIERNLQEQSLVVIAQSDLILKQQEVLQELNNASNHPFFPVEVKIIYRRYLSESLGKEKWEDYQNWIIDYQNWIDSTNYGSEDLYAEKILIVGQAKDLNLRQPHYLPIVQRFIDIVKGSWNSYYFSVYDTTSIENKALFHAYTENKTYQFSLDITSNLLTVFVKLVGSKGRLSRPFNSLDNIPNGHFVIEESRFKDKVGPDLFKIYLKCGIGGEIYGIKRPQNYFLPKYPEADSRIYYIPIKDLIPDME